MQRPHGLSYLEELTEALRCDNEPQAAGMGSTNLLIPRLLQQTVHDVLLLVAYHLMNVPGTRVRGTVPFNTHHQTAVCWRRGGGWGGKKAEGKTQRARHKRGQDLGTMRRPPVSLSPSSSKNSHTSAFVWCLLGYDETASAV